MVKDTWLDWKPQSVFKQSLFLVRFSVSVLVICLSFRVIYSTITSDNVYSIGFLSTVISKTPVEKTVDDVVSPLPAPSEDPVELQQNKNLNQIPRKETCDLSTGEWIQDPLGTMYNNESCSFITEDQNCIKNGRPDVGFLYWRWKPRDCELPRFKAVRFLESMRNKHWPIIALHSFQGRSSV